MVGGVTMSSLLKKKILMLLLLGVSVQTASYHEMATPAGPRVVSEGRRADGTWEVVIEGDVISPGGTCRTKSIAYWQYRHGKESGLGRKDLTNLASNDATRPRSGHASRHGP